MPPAGPPRSGRTRPPRRTGPPRPAARCYSRPWRGLRRRATAGHGSVNEPETTPPLDSNHIRDGTLYPDELFSYGGLVGEKGSPKDEGWTIVELNRTA